MQWRCLCSSMKVSSQIFPVGIPSAEPAYRERVSGHLISEDSDDFYPNPSVRVADDSDTEDEDNEERSDTNSVPTDYQLSDTLMDQYKPLINNQGLLVEEECILKKSEISEMNKRSTPEGITASSTLKNNDADIYIVEKRINDTLNPLLLMLTMTTNNTESAIILAVNAQASLGRVRRNNISKEIYGSEVLQPIKIKNTPKMFDETETERVK
ncbi:hypothetical protein ACTFIU_003722, partial [Dictyostelium citrinum]